MIRQSSAILAVAAALWATQAQAAPSDPVAKALAQCMVLKSTGEDRHKVARWLLAAMASAPQMAGVVTIQPGKKIEADQTMARLFTRLLVSDCAPEAKAMFKADAPLGFRTAGEALGGVAMTELMSNPQAMAAIGEYAKYIVKEDFKALMP